MVFAIKKALLALGFLMVCLTSARFATLAMATTGVINPTWVDWLHLAITVCIIGFTVAVMLSDRLKGQMNDLHDLERTAQEHLVRLTQRLASRPEEDLMQCHLRVLNQRLDRVYYTLYDSGFPYTPEREVRWSRLLKLNWQASRCRGQMESLLDQCVDLYRRLASGQA